MQNKCFSKKLMAALLTLMPLTGFAQDNTVTLPNDGEPLDLKSAALVNGVVKTDGVDDPQFDSFRNPGSATFTLNNTKANAVYTVSLGAATANAGNTLHLVITDVTSGAVEMDKTIDVEANGWQNFKTYSATTGQMAAGQKSFVINFLSTGGYTSNVNNITFNELDVASMALLTLNISPTGAGKVTADPDKSAFTPGTEVTLTAAANRGYVFSKWTDASGNVLSAENPYKFTINANTELTAAFDEAEVLNVIPTSDENPWVMENGELHGSRASFGSDHHIDWMNNGDYATYRLDNRMDAAYFTVDFTAGTQQDNVSLTFNIKNDEGTEVCNETVDIDNNGNWDSASRSYQFRTGEMLKGKYTLTITFNSVGGNGTTANINNFTFTAKEKFVSETVDNQTTTVSYQFDKGSEGQTAAFAETAAGWFKNSYVEFGSNLNMTGTQSIEGMTQTSFNAVEGKDNDPATQNAVDFLFVLKNGLTFKPTRVAYKTTRYGTGEGMTAVAWNDNGTITDIKSGIKPERNNQGDAHITVVNETVTDIPAASGVCGLRINIYQLSGGYPSRQVGLGEIEIEGVVNGATQDVKQCKLTVKLADSAAGKLTITPNGDVFDEGDEIMLTIAENFGYHFAGWQDAEANVVSTENPYRFTITGDTDLTAAFNKANTYALNVTLTEGAQPNLVQIVPAGTLIDGKRMYEEGTEVKLTASNNRILTFTGWENNSTDAERTIRMTQEQNLTASFSAVDYIVGWDLYYDQPAKDRAADYKSDSENAGLLSLRKADGTTQGWLTRGISNGFESGRPGARIWKNRSEGYYFEISFSSKGYTNLVLSNGMGVSYNTYKNYDVEYSLDGENFTKFGEFAGDLELKSGWVDGEFALPAEASEQNRVWIRWKGVESSGLVGNDTDYDGLCIGNIFVTADAGSLADEQAVLTASNPENGATGVSRNGSVILYFDKKIKAGQGKATLGDEEIEPIISGKSAVFKYAGLDYNSQYTFTMPEGVLTSRSGNAVAATTISFTTMERQQPEARLYDAVVAQDGSGDYTTVQDAIDAAPAGRAKPWLIFIKNGDYKEHVDVPKSKPYLHLIGQDRDLTIIKDDRLSGGDNAVHVSVGATVVVNADNTFFENLTMENIYGHEKQSGPQALALNTGGDRIALNNVRLLSYQDTWITTSTSNNRHYIRNSVIEGAVDFIYNSGNVYLDGDTLEINRPSGGFIVAPSHGADVKWGYVFQNNVLRPVKGMNVTDIWLGRPWHNQPKTVFINLQTYINLPAKGWYETMGGLPALWADYNTVDADGNPVDLSQRQDTYYYTNSDGTRTYGKAKNFLTDEEAAQYTLKNVMGGDDNWQPDQLCEACEAPVVTVSGTKLSWQPVPYAICYVVTRNGEVAGFTTETTFEGNASDALWQVQAVNEYGGLSPKAAAGSTDAIESLPNNLSAENGVTLYDLSGRKVVSGKGLFIQNGTVRFVK